jgi:hypothetical protein
MADVSVTLTPGAQYPVTVNDTVGSSGIAAPLTSFDVSIDAVAGINATVSGTTERIVTLVTGVPGATGASPTLSVFSTVATVPSGTNGSASLTGTTSNPVLRLTLPAGTTGPAGATGSQGPKGDQGAGINGVIIDANGHLLLSNTDGFNFDAGYVVGPPGAEGQQGIEGPQGPAGASYNQDLNTSDAVAFGQVTSDNFYGNVQAGAGTSSFADVSCENLTISNGINLPSGALTASDVGAATVAQSIAFSIALS